MVCDERGQFVGREAVATGRVDHHPTPTRSLFCPPPLFGYWGHGIFIISIIFVAFISKRKRIVPDYIIDYSEICPSLFVLGQEGKAYSGLVSIHMTSDLVTSHDL